MVSRNLFITFIFFSTIVASVCHREGYTCKEITDNYETSKQGYADLDDLYTMYVIKVTVMFALLYGICICIANISKIKDLIFHIMVDRDKSYSSMFI